MVAILVTVWISCVFGQERRPAFSSRADAVTIDVLVTKDGAPLKGLTVSNFEVKDDGVVQVIESVSTEPVQLDVACVVGPAAGGFRSNSDVQLNAVGALTSAFADSDHVTVVPFTSAIRTKEFRGANGLDLRTWLDTVPAQRGLRPMRDALFVALATQHDHPGRYVILLVSDGFDDRSWSGRDELVEIARRTDALIYVLKARREWPMQLEFTKPDFLDDVADVTGGRVIPAERNQLREVLTRLLEECRSRYVVSFQPLGALKPGWHTLDVSLRGANGRVVARRGYWVE